MSEWQCGVATQPGGSAVSFLHSDHIHRSQTGPTELPHYLPSWTTVSHARNGHLTKAEPVRRLLQDFSALSWGKETPLPIKTYSRQQTFLPMRSDLITVGENKSDTLNTTRVQRWKTNFLDSDSTIPDTIKPHQPWACHRGWLYPPFLLVSFIWDLVICNSFRFLS